MQDDKFVDLFIRRIVKSMEDGEKSTVRHAMLSFEQFVEETGHKFSDEQNVEVTKIYEYLS